MTIFGYNTDVKHAEVVYHVQSEARQNDLLLQTLVYVKGQCIGKQAFSYAAQTLEPDFSEAGIHELLKSQHKNVVDAIQQGQLESFLSSHREISDAGGTGLVLNWINARDQNHGNSVSMRFQVLDHGQPVAGADVLLLPSKPVASGQLAQGRTDSTGHAELKFDVASLDEPAVIARARRQGKSATRKFRFKKQ